LLAANLLLSTTILNFAPKTNYACVRTGDQIDINAPS
jgi:hypothetical protein